MSGGTRTDRDQFCPLCDVAVSLHDGPDSCAVADDKARLLALFGQGMFHG